MASDMTPHGGSFDAHRATFRHLIANRIYLDVKGAEDLSNIDTCFQRLEALAPNLMKILGCYIKKTGVSP